MAELHHETQYNKDWKSKTKQFQEILGKIHSTPITENYTKLCQWVGFHMVLALCKPDGSFTENKEERVMLLLETHFSLNVHASGKRKIKQLEN